MDSTGIPADSAETQWLSWFPRGGSPGLRLRDSSAILVHYSDSSKWRFSMGHWDSGRGCRGCDVSEIPPEEYQGFNEHYLRPPVRNLALLGHTRKCQDPTGIQLGFKWGSGGQNVRNKVSEKSVSKNTISQTTELLGIKRVNNHASERNEA